MSIKERVESDFKEALKSGDKASVSILRLIKSALKNKEIEKGGELTEEETLSVLNSLAKQIRESIAEYEKAGRSDLLEKEKNDLKVLQKYLPEQLSEQELQGIIQQVIDEVQATSIKDLGKVMKTLMPRLKGRADGKVVNQMVREALSAKEG